MNQGCDVILLVKGSKLRNPLLLMIRDAQEGDVEGIRRVYNHYIEHTVVSFEETPVSAEEMWSRIDLITSANFPWLVFEEGDELLGYAYAGPWHKRAAYRFSAETSVYLAPTAVGKGIGTQLYEVLLDRLREQGIHMVIGGVALPNPASVRLHEKMGFEKAAHYKEVGWKMGRWIDVGYWQLAL